MAVFVSWELTSTILLRIKFSDNLAHYFVFENLRGEKKS